MSNNVNDAFATPQSNVSGATMGSNNGGITNGIIQQLKKTRPWVLFMAILGFIGTAFMAIGTAGIFMGGGAMLQMAAGPGAAAMPAGATMGVGIVYLLMTLFYFFASLYLYKYAGSIKRVVATGSTQDLELALKSQASFWKLVGVLTLLMFILMIVGMGAAIIMPMMMGAPG